MGLEGSTPETSTYVHSTWPEPSLAWWLISKGESCNLFYDLALEITDYSHRLIRLLGGNMDPTTQ